MTSYLKKIFFRCVTYAFQTNRRFIKKKTYAYLPEDHLKKSIVMPDSRYWIMGS